MCGKCLANREQDRLTNNRFGAGEILCYPKPWTRVPLVEEIALAAFPDTPVYCNNEGCSTRPKLSEAEGHARLCNLRTILCPVYNCNRRIKHDEVIDHLIQFHNTKRVVLNLGEGKTDSFIMVFTPFMSQEYQPQTWLVDGGDALLMLIQHMRESFQIKVLSKHTLPGGVKFSYFSNDPKTSMPLFETNGLLSVIENGVPFLNLLQHLEELMSMKFVSPTLNVATEVWSLKPDIQVKVSVWPSRKRALDSSLLNHE